MDFKTITLIISLIVCYSEAKVNYSVKSIETRFNDLGEGPHWDEKLGILWHVDINGFTVCRLNVSSFATDCHTLTDLLTIVHPYPNGEDLLVTQRNKLVKLNWKTKQTTLLGEVAPEFQGKERFNDGKADVSGRLWMGTIFDSDAGVVPGKGNLYTWENHKFVKQSDNFYLTNGMTWSHDNKTMFVNDSEGKKIYVFDFDLKNGKVSNKRVLASFDNDKPDGITIDRAGNLWSASYGSGRVIKIDPKTGKELDTVLIPCPLTTSVSFGGPNYDNLYVTTAYKNNGPDQRIDHPTCGHVHQVSTTEDNSFKGGADLDMWRPKDD